MSLFNNYETTSKSYDNGRRPSGSDVIVGLIQVYRGKTLQELHVLDAGCGTGNYSEELLKMGVGHVTMFDASEGMLSKAREKIEPYKDKVTIKQGILPDLPFPDGTFDVVMFNFVLHHLVKEDEQSPYQQITLTLKEAHRVLAPGGVLVLGTTLPENILQGLWFSKLVQSIADRFNRKLPPMSSFKTIIKEAQFSLRRAVSILGMDGFVQYDDLEGPLKPEWRSGGSFWTVATDDEIKDVGEKVTQLKKDGKLEEYFKEHDKTDSYGMFTFLFSLKQ